MTSCVSSCSRKSRFNLTRIVLRVFGARLGKLVEGEQEVLPVRGTRHHGRLTNARCRPRFYVRSVYRP